MHCIHHASQESAWIVRIILSSILIGSVRVHHWRPVIDDSNEHFRCLRGSLDFQEGVVVLLVFLAGLAEVEVLAYTALVSHSHDWSNTAPITGHVEMLLVRVLRVCQSRADNGSACLATSAVLSNEDLAFDNLVLLLIGQGVILIIFNTLHQVLGLMLDSILDYPLHHSLFCFPLLLLFLVASAGAASSVLLSLLGLRILLILSAVLRLLLVV